MADLLPIQTGDKLIVGDGWRGRVMQPKFRTAEVISLSAPDHNGNPWPRIRYLDNGSELQVSPLVADTGRRNWLDPIGRGVAHVDEDLPTVPAK